MPIRAVKTSIFAGSQAFKALDYRAAEICAKSTKIYKSAITPLAAIFFPKQSICYCCRYLLIFKIPESKLVSFHAFSFHIAHHLVYSSLIKFNNPMRPCALNQLLCAIHPSGNEQKSLNPYWCCSWGHCHRSKSGGGTRRSLHCSP